jgi:allantoin racemase
MRVLYQLTSPMHRTLGRAEIERRREFLAGAAAPGCRVEVAPLDDGPPAIEGPADAALVVPELLQRAPGWGRDGYDAVIIGCFSDPGLDALSGIAALPVVGPGAAAMHLAAQFGSRFSILSPTGREQGRVRARLRGLGVDALFASVRGVGCTVMDLARQEAAARDRIVAAGRRCIDEDGADILVLGCMSMAFLPGLAAELQALLGCPVVNPVAAALKTAEAAVALGLRSRAPAAALQRAV